MRHLRAAVIGLGALGNEAVRLLGLFGISELILVDPDRVEASNLSRSVFFRSADAVGKPKTFVMEQAVHQFFPAVSVRSFACEVADIGFCEWEGCGLFFSCVDSDSARLDIAYIANCLGIPVADAGLGARRYSRGRVTLFPGGENACYGCLLAPRKRRELLLPGESVRLSCWDVVDDNEPLPSTPTMASAIAAIQVERGLRDLWLQPSPGAFSLELALDGNTSLQRIEHRRGNECPLHQTQSPRLQISADRTANSVLRDLPPASSLLLDFPLCVSAQCKHCEHRWCPALRLAILRRAGVCPACNSRQITPVEVIDAIDIESHWAMLPLRDLGLPERHLYRVHTVAG